MAKKEKKVKSPTYEVAKGVRGTWTRSPVTKVHNPYKDDPYKNRRKDKSDRNRGSGDYDR